MILPRSFFWLLASTATLAVPAWAADPVAVAPAQRPPLTTVAAAFARWPELASDEQPVLLEGVVTGTMPSGAFRMHDGQLGIYATKSPQGQTLTPGERIRVAGMLRKGGFSPWITPQTITQLGPGSFPTARPATYGELASGADDNQWVEIEGIVRSVGVLESRDFTVLDLGMIGGNLRVLVNYEPNRPLTSLVDSVVRVRGVAAVNVNKHGHVVEPSFRVPSSADITVLQPGQPDPFAPALVPLDGLMKFSPGLAQQHRVRTRGVVTRQLSGTALFLRDRGLGLKVESDQPVSFQPGDVVEAAGFPSMAEGMAVLAHAVCRVVGNAPPPEPRSPRMAALLDGTSTSELVRVRARLVDSAIVGRNVTLIFQSDEQLFKGLLNLPDDTPPVLPANDSVVDVTGICIINELEDLWFYQPRSFLLLVANLADLHVLQAPPWWTPERLRLALTIASMVLFAAAGWVWALRRQVGRKVAVIEQQARHAAALEERSRIARDLHDTLEQGLTGLSLQMKAVETDLDSAPEAVRSRLQFARKMLRQSRALARNAIRELRSEAVPGRSEGLLDGLKRITHAWNHSGALDVNLEITGVPRPLPLRVEHHLLGIGTEAITNAVKHGSAEAICVRVNFGPDALRMTIEDNGHGFEAAQQLGRASGCFGLLGMRERTREIGGELRIESRPERTTGTEVTVTLPLAALLTPAPAAAPAAAAVEAAPTPVLP